MTEAPRVLEVMLQILRQAQQQHQTLTYRELMEQLELPVPKMQSLARLLERCAQYDAAQAWPLRSVMVVSQTSVRLPRQGFFDFLFEQNILEQMNAEQQHAWYAQELARVFAFSYPGGTLCSGGNGEPSSAIG